MYTLAYQTNHLKIENIFTFQKKYIFDLLFHCIQKKTYAEQSVPYVFLLCLKRTDSQTFKSIATTRNLAVTWTIS